MDDSEHEARWSSAHNARTEGAFEEALRAYDEVTLLAERDHWPERQLEAHLYAADCARRLSQLDVSEQHLYAAVEIGRRRGLDGLLARALGELGTIAVHRGEVGVGSAWYREALELAQKAGEARAEATQLGNLGLLALQRGDHAQARTLLRQRLESVLALRAPHEAADTLTTLAEVELASGDPIAAEKALLRSLTLRRGKRTPRAVRGLACALILLARITREQGRLEEAQRLASRALRAAEAAKAQREASHARLQLGHLAQARGERTLAKHYLERAAEELHLLGEALQGLVADVALAGLAVDEGLLNEARKTYERIADGFEDHGNPKAAIDATLLAAQLELLAAQLLLLPLEHVVDAPAPTASMVWSHAILCHPQ